MKNRIPGIVLTVFLAFTFACYEKPVIMFDKTEHDFGKVQKSSAYKYSFQFKNTGNAKLIIDRIKTG